MSKFTVCIIALSYGVFTCKIIYDIALDFVKGTGEDTNCTGEKAIL